MKLKIKEIKPESSSEQIQTEIIDSNSKGPSLNECSVSQGLKGISRNVCVLKESPKSIFKFFSLCFLLLIAKSKG